ncbi:hypothetical protein BX616_000755 [Lobosporangium transversale]|uniref:Wax synthase domain-containing protein n=1 Tax=Lobosporangium transversale TaxID=64571 RepID=A0A1Y2GKV6_9FUNG|nr:hypothetical protein BCR41DRAFT_423153 [Lobosporangium transversale]KAF9906327.1 hypothetical protein BX616_000755 [Lobosporangium transversale]ORZ12513.1 hypothetical protein BCR41DRAFT_423153 [Lobosporangium transversale]|eukprot:XP_021880132.1 hypothetical protein BCR41DRAFT_423153 [Lobosporangium transversale]
MASVQFSSLISQLFSNQTRSTYDAASAFPSYAAVFIANAVAAAAEESEFSWLNPLTWKWTYTTESHLFALVTTRPNQDLLPPQKTISSHLFFGVFFFCLNSLFLLLMSPFPRTTRRKQFVAFPLLAILLLEPLLFNNPSELGQMCISVIAIATGTRMVDLYYVQPWTGIPSRYYLNSPSTTSTLNSTARSKKDLNEKDRPTSNADSSPLSTSASNSPSTSSLLSKSLVDDNFLMWDMDRLKMELWFPFRRFSSHPGGKWLRWQDLVPVSFVYNLILDYDIYYISQYTSDGLDQLPILHYGLCMSAIGIFIMIHLLWIYVTVAMIYSMCTGRRLSTKEWSMLENRLPCFALTPVDFWRNWQTVFRYLWVDLGFLPVQRYCKQHLGPDRLGHAFAKVLRQALPALSVFALSAILRAYIVYAVWREPIWSQLLYFTLQGIAVVLTRTVEMTPVGAWIKDTYNKGGRSSRWIWTALGLSMMAFFHTLTLPFFVHPYKTHNIWLPLRQRSVLWWMFVDIESRKLWHPLLNGPDSNGFQSSDSLQALLNNQWLVVFGEALDESQGFLKKSL